MNRSSPALLMIFLIVQTLSADDLAVEFLGVVERQARIRGHAISPGTDRYPPRLLIGFVDGDGTWIVNLNDGSARRAEAPGFEDDYLQWPTFIGKDGKLFSSCGRGGLSVYDPVTDVIKLVRPIPNARWLRGMAIGPAGAVYVADYPTGSAAQYDPVTGAVTHYGPQGGPFQIKNIYGYSIGCDGSYVYTATGKMPWFVVAFDKRAGTQRNLFEYQPSEHPEVHQRGNRVFLEVKPSGAFFELKNGAASPVDTIPRFDDSQVPGKRQPQPEVQSLERTLPVREGGAVIRYRPPDSDTWNEAKIALRGNDIPIQRIAPLSDGRIALSTGPYGNVYLFDPVSNKYTFLGNPAGKNIYDLIEIGGTIYFCGYPNGVFGSINEDKARVIGSWHDSIKSKHAKYLVTGADGKLYSGNHNERESTGGSLGWFDPGTQSFGGIQFPHDDCEFLTTAMSGRYIVYASDFTIVPSKPEVAPRHGRLIIFDTEQQKVVRQISPVADGSAGVILESGTEPGKMIGLGKHEKRPVLYRVDITTGEVEQRSPLPGPAPRIIARGPDNRFYFFIENNLVRTDPATFEIEIICPAKPGRMTFAGSDLYLAGEPELRRVRGVAETDKNLE